MPMQPGYIRASLLLLLVSLSLACLGQGSVARERSTPVVPVTSTSARTDQELDPPPAQSGGDTGQTGQAGSSAGELSYEVAGPVAYAAYGQTVLLGVIRNTGTAVLPTFAIKSVVYDRNGGVVHSETSNIGLEALPPGGATPYVVSFDASIDWDRCETEVDTSAWLVDMMDEFYFDLDVTDVTGFVRAAPEPGVPGTYEISGAVTNNGARPADYVMVAIMVTNAKGDVVTAGATSADAREPGSTARFQHSIALYESGPDLSVHVVAAARAMP